MALPSFSSSSSETTTTFHFFPRLPYELRIFIWEMAVYSPRVINIHVGQVRQLPKRDIAMHYSDLKLSTKLLLTSTPAPAALHACQEARNYLTDPVHGAKGSGYYEKMPYWALERRELKCWWRRR
ncbi:hypothetical protein SMACR_00745 [Sordaria macrospora]|uniref:WGS project CABT00000000 data, contig 2.2 n=2 Tax=Sordaria macrospora TaxID=5147 RepID=F7VMY9_SORMK|nr:uncharacterized protein SMAC_00745 [Sordaria macrospora k-hell]KAA8634769.1 hypothetical protein SMACR_00745 [Sordaria macrospora]WPJ61741.1 hypothetical protein SMAC4_00745 [Sordaria macrospora]CCC06718.1 unnamed protein product [Sordaria macrospora k-hell]